MNESARKRLGKIAKELRKKAKKNQQELADALNIARTDISAFEKRGEKLGLERMETLFDFFGCEITVSEKKTSQTLKPDRSSLRCYQHLRESRAATL